MNNNVCNFNWQNEASRLIIGYYDILIYSGFIMGLTEPGKGLGTKINQMYLLDVCSAEIDKMRLSS